MNGETQRFRKVVGGREAKGEEEWSRESQSEGERKTSRERSRGLECGRER